MRWLYALVVVLALPAAHGAEVQGRVDWARVAGIGTPVSGRVESVAVEAGERVEAGQVLVRLDPRPFRIRVERARARVEGSEPGRAEARREKERAEELYDQTLLSDHERELARIAFAEADAAYRAARADWEEARLHQEYATVEAPFPALVVARDVHPGETVVNGVAPQVLVRLAALDRMRVRAPVAADALPGLAPGTRVQVSAGGDTYPGRVAAVEPAADGGHVLAVDFEPAEPLALWGRPARVVLP